MDDKLLDSSELGEPVTDGIFSVQEETKLPVILVGLPGRGKTFMAKRLAKYLNWISISAKIYTVGNYRQQISGFEYVPPEFFNPSNKEFIKIREQASDACMNALIDDNHVGIFDGTNLNQERREKLYHKLKSYNAFSEPVFISVDCTKELADEIFHSVKMSEKEFSCSKSNETDLHKDYKRRIEYLEKELDWSFIKIFRKDASKYPNYVIHRMHGYIQSKIITFLMNLHPAPKTIFISRHGQSLFNIENRIGGNPDLSPAGKEYAEKLGKFVSTIKELPSDKLIVWTSTLFRTQQTSKFIECNKKVEWRLLNEIDAGICEDKTYEEVEKNLPEIYYERKINKLTFRYTNGESYLDVINRLEPVIMEIERMHEPLLIVSHQAVIRCLRAYFEDTPREKVPTLDIPLHKLMKFTLEAENCKMESYQICDTPRDPKH